MKENTSPDLRFPAVSKPVKSAFYSCVILTIAIHLFVFTNIIPNSDGLSRVYDHQQMTISGRWFLHYASVFHGFLQAPGLIGALTVLFLGLSAAMIADLLELRRVSSAIICGGALASMPALAYTLLYTFTASAYAFAVLLAVLSVWLLRRKKWGLVPGALALACTLGTYQAYFSIAVALCLMCAIFDLLDRDKPLARTVREGLLSLAMLALAAAAYVVILQIFLWVKDVELLNYRGMQDASSSLSPAALLRSSFAAYKELAAYFLLPAFSNPWLTAGNWLFILAGLAGGILLAVDRKPEPRRLVLLIVGLCLMPLACNLTRLMADIAPNMCFPFACIYLFAVGVIDRTELPRRWLLRCECAAAALIILGGAQVSNMAYVSSATAHRATQTFATNLVARVEQTPGYRSGMDVIVVGPFPQEVYHSDPALFAPVEHYSCVADTVITRNKHVYYYLNTWLNVPWPEPSEEVMQAVSDSQVFQDMPLYPSDGSVCIDGDRVIVKLAPRYVPKQPYEIAYEQRR